MPRVVVSLTTSPTRSVGLPEVLKALAAQTVSADQVIVCVPPRFRDVDLYPAELNSLVNPFGTLWCFEGPDPGPIAKILPLLEREGDDGTIIITVDDDVIYPPDMIERFLGAINQHRGAAVGFKGFDFERGGDLIRPRRGPGGGCDVLQGYGAVAYQRKHVDLDVLRGELDSYPPLFRFSDDIILSNHLAKNQVPRCTVGLGDQGLGHLPVGDEDPEALKFVGGGTHQRYLAMRTALKDQGRWYL